jgi:hypothetical protein
MAISDFGLLIRKSNFFSVNPTTFPSAKILIVEDANVRGKRAEYKIRPGRTHFSAIRNISEQSDAGNASGRHL